MLGTAELRVEVKAKRSKEWDVILDCIDMLGSALADHDHQWTNEERKAYERAITVVGRLVVVE